MNPNYVPREYMDECIDSVFLMWEKYWSVLVVMATGTGKTEAYLQIVERFLEENPTQKALVVAHREELISQPANRYRRNTGSYPSIEMGDERAGSYESELFDGARRDERTVIATMQTLNSGRRCQRCTADCQTCAATGKVDQDCGECDGTGYAHVAEEEGVDDLIDDHDEPCIACDATGKEKGKCKLCKGDGWICIEEECDICFEHFCRRMQKFDPAEFGLLVIDEAHHSTADTYTRLIRYLRSKNPNLLVVGFTATPDRADEEELGKVYQTVAYEYNLPKPIQDGWLVPVEQRFILVEDLNLSLCRTTAGDLNGGDLEREMMAETILHKITTPLIEIACNLPEGTIDRLIKENSVDQLTGLCGKREPTLVHAASVAHAERLTEIINRYLPDSALCIVGTTDKEVRRDGITRFGKGEFQFILSCGVFLEGTDLPTVSIVAMARPTKSRSLYAQMLGRALRVLSGLVDGVSDVTTRLKLIAASEKPKCLAIDFVGNSGRHKLVNAADVLGNAEPDELVDRVIRKAMTAGQPVDILREMQRVKDAMEAERKEQNRKDAEERRKKEEEARKKAADRRSGIVAGATYSQQEVDPFCVFDLAPEREPGYYRGKPPTPNQIEFLNKAKIPIPEEATLWQCSKLIEEVIRRRKKKLCTYGQAKTLKQWGFADADEWSFDRASNILGAKINPGKYLQEKTDSIRAAKNGDELTAVAELIRKARSVLPKTTFAALVNVGQERRKQLEGKPKGPEPTKPTERPRDWTDELTTY